MVTTFLVLRLRDSKASVLTVEARGAFLRPALQELGFGHCAEPDFQ